MPRRLVPLLLAITAGVSCGGTTAGSRSAAAGAVVPLHIEAEPAAVEVFLDGRYMGELQRWHGATLPVEPGPHRLELTSPGHFPLRRQVQVGPEGASFKALLRKDPRRVPPDGGGASGANPVEDLQPAFR